MRRGGGGVHSDAIWHACLLRTRYFSKRRGAPEPSFRCNICRKTYLKFSVLSNKWGPKLALC